jgi:hypothetical protein
MTQSASMLMAPKGDGAGVTEEAKDDHQQRRWQLLIIIN